MLTCPCLKMNENVFQLLFDQRGSGGRVVRTELECSLEGKLRDFSAYSSLIKNKCGKLF